MNKRSFFKIGLLPGIILILCACKGNGCGGDDCMTCDKASDGTPYRRFAFQINNAKDICDAHARGMTYDVPDLLNEHFENSRILFEKGLKITWSSQNKYGEIIQGESTNFFFNGNVYFAVNTGSKQTEDWVDDLAEPPIFTVHVDGDEYEDVVFTLDETLYQKRDVGTPSTSCYGYHSWYFMNMPCINIYKKNMDCKVDWNPYDVADACQEAGFRLLKTYNKSPVSDEDGAHE